MKTPSGNSPGSSGRLPDSLPGLDITAFRVMVRGNEDMLRKLLEKFFDGYGDMAARIAAEVAAGDAAGAAGTAHTLKGVSGNMRAGRVFEAAKALESALKMAPNGPEIAPLLTELAAALDEVMAGLGNALGRPPASTV